MSLAEYQATRLDQIERKTASERTISERYLRDVMHRAEPEQAAEIARRATQAAPRVQSSQAANGVTGGAVPAREAALATREADADRVIRAADLRTALAEAGLRRGALDDALTLLDRDVPDEYDDAALTTAVARLRERRPILFAARPNTPPGPRLALPTGRPDAKGTAKPVFGAAGAERAKKQFRLEDIR
ncbi:MAG: hypothetical protein NVSMB48_05580 [Marmoricola sp.]